MAETLTVLTDEDVARSFAAARDAADHGPVFIAGAGGAHHVLISLETYRALSGPLPKIADLLTCPGAEAVELDLPERRADHPRSQDL